MARTWAPVVTVLAAVAAGCGGGAAASHVAIARPKNAVMCRSPTLHRTFDARTVLGLRRQRAERMIREHGCLSELWKVNGHMGYVDLDYVPFRVDLDLQADIVTNVSIG